MKTIKRLISFLVALESRAPTVRPYLSCVQRKDNTDAQCVETRSAIMPMEPGWEHYLTVTLHDGRSMVTLFLTKADWEKTPDQLVEDCLACLAKSVAAKP